MKKHITLACLAALTLTVQAQQGGISNEMLKQIQSSYKNTSADKAIRNAIGGTDIRKLSLNQENQQGLDTDFSIKVESKGITDQQSSGRCWLFTGLNVMRAKAIARYNLPSLEFSQAYSFFWDQLEKSNLFLQGVIDTAKEPMSNQTVEWLFKHPLSDGGTFTGVADIVSKYGLVPKEVMPETYSSEHTSQMSSLIGLKLKEYGLELRESVQKGMDVKKIEARKTEMLETVYRILVLNLGVPPTEDFDRHCYDGKNWTYVNLPVEEIKEMAIASLKDSTRMYFSSDVTQLDSKRGLLDVNNYDFGSMLGTTFGMDKKQRIQTFASMSAHAMTLMAVDLDENGKPKKWMVENSWGAQSGYKGHLIMTDEWFNEYMFRLVLETKYVPKKVLDIFKQKPVRLPAWDPMFAPEE